MIVPRHKNKEWFWGLGEVTVDGWDLPHDALCFRDEGCTPRSPWKLGARVIFFDALGADQEGLGQTDFKKSHVDPPPQDHRNRPGRRSTAWSKKLWEASTKTKSHAPPCVTSPRRPVGMSRKAWKVQRVSAVARGLIPLPPDSILNSILPRSAVMSQEHDSILDSIPPCSPVMSQENDSMTELRAQEHLWIDWLKGYALNKIVLLLSLPLIFLKCVSLEFQRSCLCIGEQKRPHFKTGSLIGVKVYNMPLPAS